MPKSFHFTVRGCQEYIGREYHIRFGKGRNVVRIVGMDLSDEGVVDCASFLGSVFNRPDHFTPAYVDWQYNQNPVGKTIAFNAVDDYGRIVGHYALQQLEVMLMGERVKGLLAINGAVSREVQGSGVFTNIVMAAEDHVRSLGFIFKVGVSNRIATIVHEKKTGLKKVCALRAMLGFGLPAYEISDDNPEFRNIWSVEALKWRTRNPSSRYRIVQQNSDVVVQVQTGKAGITGIMGRFESSLADNSNFGGFPAYSPVRLWIGLDNRINWRKSLFFNLPLRMRPSPLNLVFKDISGSGIILDPGRIRFQAIDFDAY